MLNDLYHFWSTDLSTDNSGDLLTVSGALLGQQRILRRLMTNPGNTATGVAADYLAQPTYGAGLPGYIGQLINEEAISALILSQLQQESVVSQSPAPTVSISQTPTDLSAFTVSIRYTDSTTNTSQILAFDVTQ